MATFSFRNIGLVSISVVLAAAAWGCGGNGETPLQPPPPQEESVAPASPETGDAVEEQAPAPADESSARSSGEEAASDREGEGEGMEATVALEPSTPATGDTLKAVASLSDDAFGEVRWSYRWSVNGAVVQEGPEEVLEAPFREGDFVEVEATANRDGEEASTTRTVRIANAPPRLSVASQTMTPDGGYEAVLQASDPEGGPVTLSLKSGPEGMILDAAGRRLTWSAGQEVEGSYTVEVSARDDGEAETILSFKIQFSRGAGPSGGEG